jgi:alanine racemase
MQKTLSVIRLGAVQKNVDTIKRLAKGKSIFAVVKANAYGHGALPVAHAIQNMVSGFCVAILEEGIALRVGGIQKPILVFAPPLTHEDAERMAFYGLTATVQSEQTATLAKRLTCHIKVNTGMNRYGCRVEELPRVLLKLQPEQIGGVYSHLYCPTDEQTNLQQLAIFNQAEKLVKEVAPQAVAHLAASGGILEGEAYLKDAVRPGILLYGYAPNGQKIQGICPALSVYARRMQTTTCVGEGAGYGTLPQGMQNLATYRLGYADGFERGTPLGVGNLCMDAFVGEDAGELIPVLTDANDYATRAGTIPYEVLCRVSTRSELYYLNEG